MHRLFSKFVKNGALYSQVTGKSTSLVDPKTIFITKLEVNRGRCLPCSYLPRSTSVLQGSVEYFFTNLSKKSSSGAMFSDVATSQE